MPRIKLSPLDTYRFEYRTTINARDVNYGGHLGNDAVVSLLHEARIDLLHSFGFTELDLGDRETGIIVSELQVSYRAEGHLLDEIIIQSDVIRMKNASFRMAHRIQRGDDTLVLAEVGIVAFNYKTRQVSELPELFQEKVAPS